MVDNGNSQGTPTPQPPRSGIMIMFDSTGSALFSTAFEGVTPAQVLLAAEYLKIKATMAIEELERPKIEVGVPQDYPGLFTAKR